MRTYKNKQNNREKGNRGEDIACVYLENRGFEVVERNYLKKWGEIDIVALKDGLLNFIEVKSVIDDGGLGYRPEENVHSTKIKRLRRVIQTYLAEKASGTDTAFVFHIVTVRFLKSGLTKIDFMENIIL